VFGMDHRRHRRIPKLTCSGFIGVFAACVERICITGLAIRGSIVR
jgi:hypothetical protein